MSKRIPRLSFDELPPDLAALLRPRVERLGYLGEFFQCAAQQPAVLRSFLTLTDDLKDALPADVTEVVALTSAGFYANDYERHQHERLCRSLGLSDVWIRAVEALDPDVAPELTSEQRTVQRSVLAVLARRGRGVEEQIEALVDAVGAARAIAVLFLAGRYATHALVVNSLGLAPPVASALADPPVRRGQPLWISEADVRRLLSLDEAIAVLEDALRREARGEAQSMPKTHTTWAGGNTLHAIGAVFPAEGLAGTKTWAHTRQGAAPVFALFDAADGGLMAMIEAFALGQLRTGGISGLATRWLASPAADEMAIIGTGKQALMQARAVAAVRPLRRVRVHSPTPAHREAFAEKLRAEIGVDVAEVGSVDEAVDGVPIVTLVTRAVEPFLTTAMVGSGTHVNAVGAITLDRIEFEPALLGRCRVVAADSVAAVRELSRELREFYGEGEPWREVRPLSQIIAGGGIGRGVRDVTLFKAMGMGLSDLALAVEIYRRAAAHGLGRWV